MRSKILEQENNSIPDLFIYDQIAFYHDQVVKMNESFVWDHSSQKEDAIHNLVGFGRMLLKRYPDASADQIEVFMLLKKCPSS